MTRCFLLFTLLLSCSTPPRHNDPAAGSASQDVKTKVFKSDYGGFGYDIEVDGTLVVHQPNIPVIAGYHGFATEQQAQNVAALVVQKIKNHEIPPTLTAAELAPYINL